MQDTSVWTWINKFYFNAEHSLLFVPWVAEYFDVDQEEAKQFVHHLTAKLAWWGPPEMNKKNEISVPQAFMQ